MGVFHADARLVEPFTQQGHSNIIYETENLLSDYTLTLKHINFSFEAFKDIISKKVKLSLYSIN
jgi:hypothetical protein